MRERVERLGYIMGDWIEGVGDEVREGGSNVVVVLVVVVLIWGLDIEVSGLVSVRFERGRWCEIFALRQRQIRGN